MNLAIHPTGAGKRRYPTTSKVRKKHESMEKSAKKRLYAHKIVIRVKKSNQEPTKTKNTKTQTTKKK